MYAIRSYYGSTNPGDVMCSVPRAIRIEAEAKAGGWIRKMFWPATGNRPRLAHTYQLERPPESSFPGNPPRPVENFWWIASCRNNFV